MTLVSFPTVSVFVLMVKSNNRRNHSCLSTNQGNGTDELIVFLKLKY